MIIFLGILFVCGCAIAQSSKSETTQLYPQIEMVFVEGGTFIMGCTSEQREDCFDNEKPTHQVTLSDFYIGKFPVTQAQWKAIMGSDNNPSWIKGDNLPVERVKWESVQEFIKRLNERTSGNYRLPTEAEWEYTARGGNQSQGYKYSGSNEIDEVAWYAGNSGDAGEYSDRKIHPIGTKNANELGIYDMSGNVKERVSDWSSHYYTSIPQANPQGPETGSSRVVRGGSGYALSDWARVSRRDSDSFFDGLGFRLAYGIKTDVHESDEPAYDNFTQLKAVCEPDAREIVEKFFQYDFEGYMLSSKGHEAIWKLTWENGEIDGEGPIFVTKSYRVISTEEYEDACRVTVRFNAYGNIDRQDASNEKVGFVFQDSPSEKEETVEVRCLEEGDCRINMAEFGLRPHPGKAAIEDMLENLYRMQGGESSREQEVRDLQEIIKSLQ